MEPNDYLNKLRSEIEEYLKSGKIGDLLSKIKNINSKMISDLHEEVFIKLNTLSVEDIDLMNEVSKSVLQSFSHLGNKIDKDIKNVLYDKSIDIEEKKKILEHKLQAFKHYAFTWAATGTGAINQTKIISDSLNNGITKFKFVGPAPERKFCIQHYEKSYTMNEIKQMDNGQGLKVLYFRGGYNCRHIWVADNETSVQQAINTPNSLNNNKQPIKNPKAQQGINTPHNSLNNTQTDPKITELKDIKDYVKLSKWIYDNVVENKGKPNDIPDIKQINFKDYKIEDLKKTFQMLYEQNKKYGLEKLKYFVEYVKGTNACYEIDTDTIAINKECVNFLNNDVARFIKANNVELTKYHSYYYSNDMSGLLVHEYGHRISHKLNSEDCENLKRNYTNGDYNSFCTSRANASYSEFVAEMFSLQYHGQKTPKDYINILKKKEVFK